MAPNGFDTEEDFDAWFMDMDDVIDDFLAQLPPALSDRLDLSPESLDVLEGWILQRYTTPADLLNPREARTLDALARYIGEVFREELGGGWTIQFGDGRGAYEGLPILRNLGPGKGEESPHSLITAAVDRKKGTYIRSVLDGFRSG